VIRKLVFLLAIVAIVSGATIVSQAQPQHPVTRHTRDEVVRGTVPLVGHLPANQSMDITLILQHRNQAELDQLLKDLYDRTSPSYRQFLTVEQFTERFGPSREDYETVKNFARANGLRILSTSSNRMNLRVRGSVENIEKALNVRMGVYQHPTESRTFFGPDREPSLDMPVRLWAVGSLDTYSTPKPMVTRNDGRAVPEGVISNATTGSCPDASFCGSDMRAAYYGGTALDGSGQSLGLFEFVGTDLTDLTTYFTNAGQTNNVPITLTSVDTQKTLCKEPTCDDTEQTIDMTQAIGMAPGLSSLVMWIGTGGLSGQTLDDPGILNGMATASPLNAQLSCSWEWKPTDNTTDDVYFQEFAVQGQNFFVAAGDSGKWTASGFVWPADDPYIVSVGGTDLTTTGAGGSWATETGWVDGGGGISPNKFAIPSWQVAAAAGCAKCSQVYRNGPDVSANSNFTFYVCADQTTCTANNYGGTSFATPMWAGLLALTNQQALLNGNHVLGFINPALYTAYSSSSYDADFHDITSGGNTYGATVGYDLATGIGSPQAALIDVLAGSPSGSFDLAARPRKISIAQGSRGQVRIQTAAMGGFDSSVALTATGQPTGVAVRFNPSTIAAPGSGTSAMVISVSTAAKTGVYTITVTGTGGGKTKTITISLNVT
jgi:subtilase family serine protease